MPRQESSLFIGLDASAEKGQSVDRAVRAGEVHDDGVELPLTAVTVSANEPPTTTPAG